MVAKLKLYLTNSENLNLPADFYCPVCLDQKGEPWVFHEGGDKHPLHEGCSQWQTEKGECPICRKLVDITSLTKYYSLKNTVSQIFTESLGYPTEVFIGFLTAAKVLDFAWEKLFSTAFSYSTPLISIGGSAFAVASLGGVIKCDNFQEASVFLVSRTVGVIVLPLLFNAIVGEPLEYNQSGMMLGSMFLALRGLMNLLTYDRSH